MKISRWINYIKRTGLVRLVFSSALGNTIRRWIIGSSAIALACCLLFFYYHVKVLMEDKGKEQLLSLTADSQDRINTLVDKCADISETMAKSFALFKNDSLKVAYSRQDIINILKANYIDNGDIDMMGVYFGWDEFDNRDELLKSEPLYAKYYGRMCQFVTKYNGLIVSDYNFIFDDKLYEEVTKTKTNQVFSPVEIVSFGKRKVVIPVITPIIDNNNCYGCLVVYVNCKCLCTLAKNTVSEVMPNSGIVITDSKYNIIACTESETYIGKKVSEAFGSAVSTQELERENEPSIANGICYNISSMTIGNKDTRWIVISYINEQYILEGIGSKMMWAASLSVILLVLIAIMATIIGFKIGMPIQKMLAGVRQLASGNLNVSFKLSFFHGKTEITQLMASLDTMVKNLKRIVSDVKQSAININGASKELARSANMMASGANAQASASEEVSSAMQEMSSSIHHNAENARQTEDITNKVVESVVKANTSVSETVESMKIITDKISIINEIVGKTDLLAVNAAIEAARVGELGKGFSVVASEIRKLAEKSQNAAKEIDELTTSGVRQAESSGELLEKLVPQINRTSNLIHEITSSSVEQNNNAMQVNNALQQLNDITQQNAATAEELSTSADESQSQAESLDESMSFFRFEDDTDDEIASLTQQAQSILQKIDQLKAKKGQKKEE